MAGRSEQARGWSETLQQTLMDLMDIQIERLTRATEIAEILEVEKIAKAYGTAARAVRAVATMVPERKAAAAAEPADDDEAPMHDGIPDDPEAIQAALAERFAHIAELIEHKRRAALDRSGDAGAAAIAERAPGQAAGAPAVPGL